MKSIIKFVDINKKGLTIVEILVSITIIGILAITFMAMFGIGMKNIIIAGDNSQSDFIAQSVAENQLSGSAGAPENVSRTPIAIVLKKAGATISTISGTKISVDYPYNGTTKTAILFDSN